MTVDFTPEFVKSGGQPIEWQGQRIHRTFHFDVQRGDSIDVSFLRYTDRPVQGLSIGSEDRNVELECAGSTGRNFVLWTDTAPKHISINIRRPVRRTGVLVVRNVWRDEKYGTTMYSLNSAAIQVVRQGDAEFVLRCSDGWTGPDFNNLVVLLRLVGPKGAASPQTTNGLTSG